MKCMPTDTHPSSTGPIHFELKVPGGKLIVIDTTVDNDTITSLRLSGDFFLEPDEAYEAYDKIGPALVGTKTSASTEALESRLNSALAHFDNLDLEGLAIHDIAVTVKRAVSAGKDFTDYE